MQEVCSQETEKICVFVIINPAHSHSLQSSLWPVHRSSGISMHLCSEHVVAVPRFPTVVEDSEFFKFFAVYIK